MTAVFVVVLLFLLELALIPAASFLVGEFLVGEGLRGVAVTGCWKEDIDYLKLRVIVGLISVLSASVIENPELDVELCVSFFL